MTVAVFVTSLLIFALCLAEEIESIYCRIFFFLETGWWLVCGAWFAPFAPGVLCMIAVSSLCRYVLYCWVGRSGGFLV